MLIGVERPAGGRLLRLGDEPLADVEVERASRHARLALHGSGCQSFAYAGSHYANLVAKSNSGPPGPQMQAFIFI